MTSRASAFHRSYRPLWDGPLPPPSAALTIRELDAAERAQIDAERVAFENPAATIPRREMARAALSRLGVIGG
jgi:hypothetical protein